MSLIFSIVGDHAYIFNSSKEVEDAIEKFELQTVSKFSIYQKDKLFGAKGIFKLHHGLLRTQR